MAQCKIYSTVKEQLPAEYAKRFEAAVKDGIDAQTFLTGLRAEISARQRKVTDNITDPASFEKYLKTRSKEVINAADKDGIFTETVQQTTAQKEIVEQRSKEDHLIDTAAEVSGKAELLLANGVNKNGLADAAKRTEDAQISYLMSDKDKTGKPFKELKAAVNSLRTAVNKNIKVFRLAINSAGDKSFNAIAIKFKKQQDKELIDSLLDLFPAQNDINALNDYKELLKSSYDKIKPYEGAEIPGNVSQDIMLAIADYIEQYKPNSDSLFIQNRIEDSSPEKRRAEDLLVKRRANPSSLLSRVPNFMNSLMNPVVRNRYINNAIKLTPKIKDGLSRFKRLNAKVADIINENIIKRDIDPAELTKNEHFGKFPVRYFTRMNKLPANVTTAITYGLSSWINMSGKDTLYNDDDDIKGMLRLNDSDTVNNIQRRELQSRGQMLKRAATDIGSIAFQQLNLKMAENDIVDGALEDTLITSLGQTAIQVAIEMGIVELNPLTLAEIKSLAKGGQDIGEISKNAKKEGPLVNFVKVIPQQGSKTEMNPVAVAVSNTYNDVSKLFDKIFDISFQREPMGYKPFTTVAETVAKNTQKIPEKLRTAIESLQQQAHSVNRQLLEILPSFTPDEIKSGLMGAKDTKLVHISDVESQNGKNLSIESDYEMLSGLLSEAVEAVEDPTKAVASDKQPPNRFYKYKAVSNHRVMIDNHGSNIQSSKNIRALMQLKDYKHVFTKKDATEGSKAADWLLISVGQGLDLKNNGFGVDKTRLWDQDRTMLNFIEQTLNEPVYKNAIDGLIADAGKPLSQPTKDAVITAVTEAGEGIHSLLALKSYADFKRLQTDPFIDEMPINVFLEIDGMQSGLGISYVQLPGNLDGFIKGHLAQVGIFTQDDNARTYGDVIEHTTHFLDNYEEAGQATQNKVLESRDLDKASEILSDKDLPKSRINSVINSVLAGSLLDPFMSMFTDPDKTNPSGRKDPKSIRKIMKQPVTAFNYAAGVKSMKNAMASSVVSNIYNAMMDVTSKAIENYTPDMNMEAQINIIKNDLRNIIDKAFMTSNPKYSLYKFKIKPDKDLTAEERTFKKSIIKQLNQVSQSDFDKLEKQLKGFYNQFGDLIKTNTEGKTEQEYFEGLHEAVKAFRFPIAIENGIENTTRETYGNAAYNAVSEMMSGQTAVRDALLGALELIYGTFFHTYQDAYKKRVAEYGRNLTKKEDTELRQELYQQGIGAIFKTPATDINITDDMLETVVTGLEDLEGAYASVKYKDSPSLNSQVQRRQLVRNLGVKAIPLLIVGIESSIAAETYTNENVSQIFDAFLTGIGSIERIGKKANAAARDVNKDYSLMDAVQETYEKMLPHFNNLTLEQKRDVLNDKQVDKRLEEGMDMQQAVADRLAEVNSNFSESREMVNNNRNELFANDGITSWNHYSFDGIDVENTPGSATVLGSGPDAVQSDAAFVKEYVNKVTSDNVMHIYEKAKAMENGKLSNEHANHLQDLMNNIVTQGLKSLDPVIQRMGITTDRSLNAGFYDTENRLVDLQIASNKLSNSNDMSLQETMAHEYTHVLFQKYLDENVLVQREAERLFNLAKDNLDYTAFLQDPANASDADIAIAQQRYDYVFVNDGGVGLHEFMAMGLTNEALKKAIGGIKNKNKDTFSITEDSTNIFNPIKSMLNMFMNAMSWLTSKLHGVNAKGENVDAALQDLAVKMVRLNENHRSKLYEKVESKVMDFSQKADQKVKDTVAAAFNKTKGTNFTYEELARGNSLTREIAGAYFDKVKEGIAQSAGKQVTSNPFVKTFNEFGSSMLTEIRGLKDEGFNWRNIRRMVASKIDGPRKQMKEIVSNMIESGFDPKNKITDDQWEALNSVVLEADISTLSEEFDVSTLKDLLQNPTRLRTEIQAIRENLTELGPAGIAAANQAAGLGSLMTRGTVPDAISNQMPNAYAIAQQYHMPVSSRQAFVDVNYAEKQIEQLASLYALLHVPENTKRKAAAIFESEAKRGKDNGITNMISAHKAFKAEALDKLFDGNKMSTLAGYTTEEFDSDIRVEVAKNDPETRKHMEERGFEYVAPVSRDPRDKINQNNALYKTRVGLDKYRTSIASFQDMNRRGTTLLASSNTNLKNPAERREFKQNFDRLKHANFLDTRSLYQQDLDVMTATGSKPVPILSSKTGEVLDYRYMMSQKTKREHLLKQDKAHETLGRMFASIPGKLGTQEINKQMIDGLVTEHKAIQEYKSKGNTVESKLLGKDWRRVIPLVTISPNSSDKRLRDLWHMLPDSSKHYAKQAFGAEHLIVRENMINYIFGTRDITLTGKLMEAKDAGKLKNIPPGVVAGLRLADNAWREIIGIARAKMSILVPDVVIGNGISNVLVLLADGIPPSYIAKKIGESIIAMRSYTKDRQKLEQSKIKLHGMQISDPSNPKIKALRSTVNTLQRKLDKSPVAEMVNEGLYQTIAEDVDPDALKTTERKPIMNLFQNKIIPKVSEFSSAGAKGGKALQEALMSPGSNTFQYAVLANQLGDFSARYIKYSYDTNVRNKEKNSAINEALDDFIFYDEPTHKAMQFANDYGMLVFTKFFFRIQRVALKLFGRRPATAVMLQMLQNQAGMGTEYTINDYFLNVDKMMNRFELIPTDTAMNATDLPIMEWFRTLTPF